LGERNLNRKGETSFMGGEKGGQKLLQEERFQSTGRRERKPPVLLVHGKRKCLKRGKSEKRKKSVLFGGKKIVEKKGKLLRVEEKGKN